MSADAIILWVAAADVELLPGEVIALSRYGIEIRVCVELRSYKKIIPALKATDSEFILTADDDIFYGRKWLQTIALEHRPGTNEVLCGRAHRVTVDQSGAPLPYELWHHNINASDASELVFPTGVGGVLYERSNFYSDVCNEEIFMRLCPTGDDIWLYWMGLLRGVRFRKVGNVGRAIYWPGSQRVSLYKANTRPCFGNDLQIQSMIAQYGFPPTGLGPR